MSVFSLQNKDLNEKYSTPNENKLKYGEVITPITFVEKMLDLLPNEIFKDPKLKWLDPCAGTGNFCIILYQKLFENLSAKIKEPKKRHHHIINNMIHMIELNNEHLPILYKRFGENANIECVNYLTYKNNKFDVIIGNPPFNVNGAKKVPTNNKYSKKKDGKAIWMDFIEKSINLLSEGGYINMITPSIWMKRDHSFFKKITQSGEIIKLHTLTNTETNKVFLKQAQTPTCYFVFKKGSILGVKAYNSNNEYLLCDINLSIPLKYPKIILKLQEFVSKVGYIPVIKTSFTPDYKGYSIKPEKDKNHTFHNISTCILNKLQPELVVNYSNKPCYYQGKEKLVLAHKMYGFPYYDEKGFYGISNRDNYIILNYTKPQFEKLKDFLSSKLALLVFETTRYRMKYLERYAFEFLPDITKLTDFPNVITEESLNDYFKFDEIERKEIHNITKKNYNIIN